MAGIDADFLIAVGYQSPKQLEDGEWAAILPLLFTTSLVIRLDRFAYERRYCYEKPEEAQAALAALKTAKDDPLPGWVAKRPQD